MTDVRLLAAARRDGRGRVRTGPGRALGMAGMLVIPGSGVATAEDMQENQTSADTSAEVAALPAAEPADLIGEASQLRTPDRDFRLGFRNGTVPAPEADRQVHSCPHLPLERSAPVSLPEPVVRRQQFHVRFVFALSEAECRCIRGQTIRKGFQIRP